MNALQPIIYVGKISENSVLAIIETDYLPTGEEVIWLDGVELPKPYLMAKLQKSAKKMLGLILHLPENCAIISVEKLDIINNQQQYSYVFTKKIDQNLSILPQLIKILSAVDVAKLLYILLQFSNNSPKLMLDSHYWNLCNKLRQAIAASELDTKNSCWLLPNLLLISANFAQNINWQRANLMICSENGVRFNEIIPIFAPNNPQKTIGLLIPFSNHATAIRADESMTIFLRDRTIALAAAPIAIKSIKQSKLNDLIIHLQNKLPQEIFEDRGGICQALIALKAKKSFADLIHIIKTLQLYLPCLPHDEHSNNFKIQIDSIAEIPNEGTLVSGWIYDPHQMFDCVNIMNDLGNFFADVELINNFNHPSNPNHQGFLIWLEHKKNSLSPYGLWLEATLKSGFKCNFFYAASTTGDDNQSRLNFYNSLKPHLKKSSTAMQLLQDKIKPII